MFKLRLDNVAVTVDSCALLHPYVALDSKAALRL